LDEGLALSGRKFGVDRSTALQVLLRWSQPEWWPMTETIATSRVRADKCPSQAHLRGFSHLPIEGKFGTYATLLIPVVIF